MKNSKAMLSIAFFIVVGKLQQYAGNIANALKGKTDRPKQSTIIVQLSLILYAYVNRKYLTNLLNNYEQPYK